RLVPPHAVAPQRHRTAPSRGCNMKIVRATLVLALAAALGSSVVPGGNAQDRTARKPDSKGLNKARATASAKTSAATQSVPDTIMAYSLIEYGRKHKAPEALLTAARILANQPKPTKPEGKPETTRHTREGKEGKKTESNVDNDPKALLA